MNRLGTGEGGEGRGKGGYISRINFRLHTVNNNLYLVEVLTYPGSVGKSYLPTYVWAEKVRYIHSM